MSSEADSEVGFWGAGSPTSHFWSVSQDVTLDDEEEEEESSEDGEDSEDDVDDMSDDPADGGDDDDPMELPGHL